MASPKPGGFENFDWTAYFGSFERRKARPVDEKALDLSSLQPYIDEKIVKHFLEEGKELLARVKQDGYVRVTGLTADKSLKALYYDNEDEPQTGNAAHHRKCVAACAYWAMTRKYTSQTIRDNSKYVIGLPPVVYMDAQIKNSLASHYGLPWSTDLYYVMNSGLEYMIQEFPLQTTALLAWRVYRGEYKLDNSERGFSREMRLVIDYHFSRAKALNQSRQEYFNNLKDQIKEYIVYLAKVPLVPEISPEKTSDKTSEKSRDKSQQRARTYKPIPRRSSNLEDLLCCCICM